MNAKLLQDQAALLAIASKTVQRSTLFLQACQIIQEQNNVIQRLSQHVNDLTAQTIANEAQQPAKSVPTAIPAEAPVQP